MTTGLIARTDSNDKWRTACMNLDPHTDDAACFGTPYLTAGRGGLGMS
jgi:hypothetical protein